MNFFNQNKTIIIAEACDNHFGDLKKAKKMVLRAKKCGADIIKFQHHIPDEEMLKKVPKSKNFKISLYDFLKKYALTIQDHYELKKFCELNSIKYLCTPFSYKAALELNELNVEFFKIGSGEFTDLMFIDKLIKFKKPIIFSTGMSSDREIDFMCKYFMKKKLRDIAILNCTSEYPPKIEDINLGFITSLKNKYKDFVIGHSDHTNSIYTSIAAVALGAKIIEKHVYLDGFNNGPDKDVSISFDNLKTLVDSIRLVEKAIGKNKKIYNQELPIRKWARRSLVATFNIKKGEKLSEKNFFSKRPGTGIPSKDYLKIIGKVAKKNIKKDSILKYSDFY